MSGNMISRWTNIFTEDGEKSWRNRDAEFILEKMSKSGLLEKWEHGWQILFTTLESLDESDLNDRCVNIVFRFENELVRIRLFDHIYGYINRNYVLLIPR